MTTPPAGSPEHHPWCFTRRGGGTCDCAALYAEAPNVGSPGGELHETLRALDMEVRKTYGAWDITRIRDLVDEALRLTRGERHESTGVTTDGTERLCQALYGRPSEPRDYLGGSNARMLHDAAHTIAALRRAPSSGTGEPAYWRAEADWRDGRGWIASKIRHPSEAAAWESLRAFATRAVHRVIPIYEVHGSPLATPPSSGEPAREEDPHARRVRESDEFWLSDDGSYYRVDGGAGGASSPEWPFPAFLDVTRIEPDGRQGERLYVLHPKDAPHPLDRKSGSPSGAAPEEVERLARLCDDEQRSREEDAERSRRAAEQSKDTQWMTVHEDDARISDHEAADWRRIAFLLRTLTPKEAP